MICPVADNYVRAKREDAGTFTCVTRGMWIVVEGGDGAGKSTQVKELAARLQGVQTAEPGGTNVGVRIRELLLDPLIRGVDPMTEALLYAADRRQHLTEVVQPTVKSGKTLVSSRSVWSSIAYQSVRGVNERWLFELNDLALSGCWPDLVIWLEAPPEVAFQRSIERGPLDRLELMGETFQQKVAAKFAELAKRFNWCQVEASGSVDEVANRVWEAVNPVVSIWDGAPQESPIMLLHDGWR